MTTSAYTPLIKTPYLRPFKINVWFEPEKNVKGTSEGGEKTHTLPLSFL